MYAKLGAYAKWQSEIPCMARNLSIDFRVLIYPVQTWIYSQNGTVESL
jgi:hypothetical protein